MKPSEKLKLIIRQSGLSRRKWYRDVYLYSEHWRGLRDSKLKRDGAVCAHCGAREGIQCHHITYRSIYNVTLDDLMVLCKKCHKKEHRKIRRLRKEKRGKRGKRPEKFDVLKFLLESE